MSGGYMKVVISLPIKPSANNATSVSDDGKTLTWDLLSESNIHLEFSLINIGMIIGLCVLALAVVAAVVVIIIIKKGKKNTVEVSTPIQ